MKPDILITKMVDRKQMQELIYLYNKQVRPKPKPRKGD